MQNPAPGLPPNSKGLVAEYKDKYGDIRRIHRTRHGLRMVRRRVTLVLRLSEVAGPMVGEKIRQARIAAGLSLSELARKAGLSAISAPNAKHRMYEIEKGSRHHGIRLGTLYAIASAMGIQPASLLPDSDQVMKAAGVICRREITFSLKATNDE